MGLIPKFLLGTVFASTLGATAFADVLDTEHMTKPKDKSATENSQTIDGDNRNNENHPAINFNVEVDTPRDTVSFTIGSDKVEGEEPKIHIPRQTVTPFVKIPLPEHNK